MKFVSKIALGAALALSTVGASTLPASAANAQEQAEAYQAKPSRKAAKPLSAANEALQANDFATAQAELAKADAAAESADDRFITNQLRLNLAIATDDDALLNEAINNLLNSGSQALTPEKQAQFISALGSKALENGDDAAALQHLQRLAELQPNNPSVIYNVGVLQLQNGQAQQSYDSFGRAIEVAEANGETAEEAWYRQRLAAALQNEYDLLEPGFALIQAYPTPQNWRDVLLSYRDTTELSDDQNLDVFRLLHDVDALQGEGDYFEYASTAERRRLLGEAKAAYDAGISAGALDAGKPYVSELKGLIDQNYATDQQELDSLAAEAASEPNGKLAANTATAYLGYGDNQKAADLYRTALEKGGVDAADVNTRLGIALTRAGDTAGARAAFEAAKSGQNGTLADFWLAYLDAQSPAG